MPRIKGIATTQRKMSDGQNYFNMRDEGFFPTFDELPYDNDVDMRYYDDGGSSVYEPIKHWCLLGEIVQKIPWIRPMFRVKDKANKEFLVAFHFDRDVELPKVWEKRCKEGSVMAIMYANSHNFMDGQQGIRVEEAGCVKFLPCSLDTLLRIGDDVDKPIGKTCTVCKKPGALQCSRCARTKYCGKQCQVSDWKSHHKDECIAIRQIVAWKGKDWDDFDKYWMD